MSASDPAIRPATTDDIEAILGLWHAGGLDHDVAADRAEITNKLDFDGDLFLVADAGGQLVASVMGTYDGHRGRIKRAVVDPSQQGSGLGRILIAELERRFLERGITELRLEVWADNTGAFAFWQKMGWEHLPDIRYFTRSLTP